MAKNYYNTLEIQPNAREDEIALAFKRLALKYHPKYSKLDYNTTYYHFSQVAEAYEVLSDPIKKSYFDKYGEHKLKENFFAQEGLKGGYRFNSNPEEIFEKFFATSVPFSSSIDESGALVQGTILGNSFGGQKFVNKDRPNDLRVELHVTLNQLYTGAEISVTYQRQVINPDGTTTREISERKDVKVNPGCYHGQELVFKNKGNEIPGQQSDLIFILIQENHNKFKREGKNLVYVHKLRLYDALTSKPFEIKTLDHRTILVPISEIINPKTIIKVHGEGMLDQETGQKGDLLIKFDIVFPNQIQEERKEQLKSIIGN